MLLHVCAGPAKAGQVRLVAVDCVNGPGRSEGENCPHSVQKAAINILALYFSSAIPGHLMPSFHCPFHIITLPVSFPSRQHARLLDVRHA